MTIADIGRRGGGAPARSAGCRGGGVRFGPSSCTAAIAAGPLRSSEVSMHEQ